MTALDDFLTTLSEAEARALDDHRAQRCHLSERPCSYCEAEDQARGHQAPCPAWCDGTHPDPGGRGNVAHVRSVNGIGLECVTNDSGSRSTLKVRWFSPGNGFVMSSYYGVGGLRRLAADALALADEIDRAEEP